VSVLRPRWLSRWLRLAATAVSGPEKLVAGADFATAVPAIPEYEIARAMSAYGAFPWVVACVRAKATDLSGLPLRARRGRGKTAVQLDDHPALRLLAAPASHTAALHLRRQAIVDYELTGDAYLLLLGLGAGFVIRPRGSARQAYLAAVALLAANTFFLVAVVRRPEGRHGLIPLWLIIPWGLAALPGLAALGRRRP